VKRSEARNACGETPNDFLEVLPSSTDVAAIKSLWEITQPVASDIACDSEAAIQTSGDWRLVVTRALAFVHSTRYACDGC
jgi:hypothetical protein